MGFNLSTSDTDKGTVGRDAINDDEDHRGPGLEDVRGRRHLRGVHNNATVAVDGVRGIELEVTLAHVHSMCCPSRTNDDHRRVGSSIIRRTRIRRGRNGDIKVVTTVSKGARYTGRNRPGAG